MQTARGSELRQTLELLMKMQKGDNNGQSADESGKIKDSDNDVTETPPPAQASPVAASSDGQREAGSAAKRVSRKLPKRKHGSAPALEMVMAERLAERAFEMVFLDPPAELAAVKGSPRLADLKVLPGRAPVGDHGATETAATSELGTKKSRDRSQWR